MKLRGSLDYDMGITTTALCQFCSALPPDLFQIQGYRTAKGDHQPSLKALIESAKSCILCRLFAADADPRLVTEGDDSDDHIILIGMLPVGNFAMAYIRSETFSRRTISIVPFNGLPYYRRISDKPVASVGPWFHSEEQVGELKAISGQVDSEATFNLMDSWISFCKEHHPGCPKQHKTTMPRRLLDVGTIESPTLYLRETVPEHPTLPYLTLSHSWGSPSTEAKMRATTTSANIESRRKAIAFESLPKTFKDSILITRKLKVQYLWIDSLCIIQDSGEDKMTEIMNMGNIYSDSYCTIAASASTGMDTGCFVHREPMENQPVYLEWTEGNRKVQRAVLFRPRPEWGEVFANEPLNKRGWAFQERQLSLRTLHFTAHQVFWECRSSSASEMHHFSCLCLPPRKLEGQEAMDEAIKLFETGESDDFMLNDLHTRWRRILENYTSRKLTYQTDILAALAGVASKLSELMEPSKDRYVQGLWENDLAQGLLWLVVYPQHLKKSDLARIMNVNGPSWSWTSVMGRRVEYPLTLYRPRPVLAPNNKLRLSKSSREPTISCLHRSTSYIDPMPETLEMSGYLRKAKMQKCKDDSTCDLAGIDNTVSVRLGTLRCDTQADLEEDREVWILSMWDYMQVYSRNGLGLVLVPDINEDFDINEGYGPGDTFTRIGLADTLDLEHFDDCPLRRIFLV